MINDVSSYSVGDFISFSDEVYFRLFERQFEAWWPAHVLLLALGAATMVFAWLEKKRIVAILLGVPLLVSAVTFHFQLYAELTPVGQVFGWAFVIQALLMLFWGFWGEATKPQGAISIRVSGAVIALWGLVAYSLLSRGREGGPAGAEYAGMAPDPTICFVFGILLMSARPAWHLMLFPIPILWAATTGATLKALDAPHSMMLSFVAALAIIAAICKALLPKAEKTESNP